MRDPRRKLRVGGGVGGKKRGKKKFCRFRNAFSLKPALPWLYACAKSTTESKREGVGGGGGSGNRQVLSEKGVGRTGKEESSRGKGASGEGRGELEWE